MMMGSFPGRAPSQDLRPALPGFAAIPARTTQAEAVTRTPHFLGQNLRESTEDWLELGRDLTTRGLAAPRLVVADGAPGLIGAVEEIWPRADRQHCAVHRLRNSNTY